MTDLPPTEPPPPLDYASPPPGPSGGVRFIWQMLIGFGLFFVLVGGTIGVGWALPAAAYDSPVIIYSLIGSPIVLCSAFGIFAWIRWRWRGVIAGVYVGVLTGFLLAVGLVLLLIGLCFASLGRGFR